MVSGSVCGSTTRFFFADPLICDHDDANRQVVALSLPSMPHLLLPAPVKAQTGRRKEDTRGDTIQQYRACPVTTTRCWSNL